MMRVVLCYAGLMLLASSLGARELFMGKGTIELPEAYSYQRTGTKDSEKGLLKQAGNAFVIELDIGKMAGLHMHPGLKDQCIWFREFVYADRRIYVGELVENRQPVVKVSVVAANESAPSDPFAYPANFWAKVTQRSQVVDLMSVALSYQQRELVELRAISMGWGSTGVFQAGTPLPHWAIGQLEVRCAFLSGSIRLIRVELLDESGKLLALGDRELELRLIPAGRSDKDFSSAGTTAFDGKLAASSTLRLWVHARLTEGFVPKPGAVPSRYRVVMAYVTAADDSEEHTTIVEGVLEPEWPTG